MTEQDTTQTWLMSFFCFQNRYSQELALMYLWQEDYDRARHYTNMAHEFFLFSESVQPGVSSDVFVARRL